MIFVTVGTTPFPFERMRLLVTKLVNLKTKNEKIVFQHGATKPVLHPSVENQSVVPHEKMALWVKRARVVFCHAGPATIFLALSQGKKPMVLPRYRRYGEHVNDHQVHFARFLYKKRMISIATKNTTRLSTYKHKYRPLSSARDVIKYLHSM